MLDGSVEGGGMVRGGVCGDGRVEDLHNIIHHPVIIMRTTLTFVE